MIAPPLFSIQLLIAHTFMGVNYWISQETQLMIFLWYGENAYTETTLGLSYRAHCALIPEIINDSNINNHLHKRVL